MLYVPPRWQFQRSTIVHSTYCNMPPKVQRNDKKNIFIKRGCHLIRIYWRAIKQYLLTKDELYNTYDQAEIEADDDAGGDGDGSEFQVTKVAGERLGDDVHGEGGDTAEDGRTNYVPKLL